MELSRQEGRTTRSLVSPQHRQYGYWRAAGSAPAEHHNELICPRGFPRTTVRAGECGSAGREAAGVSLGCDNRAVSEDPSPSKTGIGAGYDAGYAQCPCFWGEEPGRLIGILRAEIGDFSGLRVLDAGCGEGKNAAYLARQGADVEAIDASALAINNGRRAFGTHPHLRWRVEDVRVAQFRDGEFDVVIAYGVVRSKLWVLAQNEHARRLYESRGWTPSGVSAPVPFPPYPVKLQYVRDLLTVK